MREFFRNLKKYPLSWMCILVVWILSFCTPPSTPLDNVAFIDKWAHIIMYGVTSAVIWEEYLKKNEKISKKKLFFFAWLFPILMSGAIELMQEYLTNGRRSGDWLDFAANSVGVTLSAIIYILLLMYRAKHYKDS